MWARRLLVVALLPYVVWLVLAYDYHFLDGVNLAFHEAGHLFATPLGRTAHFLGGTVGQLFFPAACMVHFWNQRRAFEAAVCGIWLAESGMNTARYLGDAVTQQLPLVGGHIHDWNWLLTRFGLLEHCDGIALAVHGLSSLGALAALCAAGWLAWRAEHEPEPSQPAWT